MAEQTHAPKNNLLFWSVLTVFLGRGLQLIFWDAPYRSILWDENFVGPLVELFMTWPEWTSWLAVDRFVNLFTRFQGALLLISGLGLLFIKPHSNIFRLLIHLSSVQLLLVAIAGFWHSHHQWPYLFEHALQVGVGQLYLKFLTSHDKALVWAKGLVALTFIGHGSYALGLYPTPGRFFDMVLAVTSFSEGQVRWLLGLAGLFDFIFGLALIFVAMAKRFERALIPLLFIAGLWGLFTASARWLAYVEYDFLWMSLKLWGPQVIFRLVHGLVPFWLLGQILAKALRDGPSFPPKMNILGWSFSLGKKEGLNIKH